MYGIFTNIYDKNQPNVGKYTIHGSYGLDCWGQPLRPKFPDFGPQVAIDELTVLYLHKGEADAGLMFVHHGVAVVDVYRIVGGWTNPSEKY